MRTFVNFAHQVGVASLLSVGLLATGSTIAQAACFPSGCSQNGLVFSEASGDFKITDITGQGTQADPFVVYQDVWGFDISLAISGLTETPQHSLFGRPGFAISIVSQNLTDAFWRFYDHELQETVGISSAENDGLSFAQGLKDARPSTLVQYTQVDEITDVRDFINFYGGDGVDLGESVQFDYVVTDTIPNEQFYIRQRPDFRTNTLPTEIVQQLALLSDPELPPAPVANDPPVPEVQPVVTPEPVTIEKPTAAPQSVPETSNLAVGILAIVLGKGLLTKSVTARQRLNTPKP